MAEAEFEIKPFDYSLHFTSMLLWLRCGCGPGEGMVFRGTGGSNTQTAPISLFPQVPFPLVQVIYFHIPLNLPCRDPYQ